MLTLKLPADYRHAWTLAHLSRDPASRTERVTGASWEAAMAFGGRTTRVRVELGPGRARIAVGAASTPGPPLEGEVQARVERRLGLRCDPSAFERLVAKDAVLRPLIRGRRGLRIPLTAEPFESVLWAILGQQITLGFARTLMGRLVELAGQPAGEGWYAPPTPAAVAALSPRELAERQVSRSKVDYLLRIAERVAVGALDLAELAEGPSERAAESLLGERGLGPWSVHYIMMRGLGFEDCVPVGDSGLLRALALYFELPRRPTARETLSLLAPFRPFRSFATLHLWQLLDEPIQEAT